MKFPPIKVIAIDDNEEDLHGLVQGLNRCGIACLQYRYQEDNEDECGIIHCPHVRILFIDLHLTVGTSKNNKSQHYSIIANIIENQIKPEGPYLVIQWTEHPDDASELKSFLLERLDNKVMPADVLLLDKVDYLNSGQLDQPDKLVTDIIEKLNSHPQIMALLAWEEQVMDATGDTVSAIYGITRDIVANGSTFNDMLTTLLRCLAEAAVGKTHVDENQFHAVNEALLPIMADRISNLKVDKSVGDLWKNALAETNSTQLDPMAIAQINGFLHIEESTEDINPCKRGTVVKLPNQFSDDKFEQYFGISSQAAQKTQYWYNNRDEDSEPFWVLVQTQAACDYAFNRPGTLPYYLGLCLSDSCVPEEKEKHRPPDALWRSPLFSHKGNKYHLHVSARFSVSISSAESKKYTPLFRLREQILNDLTFRIHGYSARLGILSVR